MSHTAHAIGGLLVVAWQKGVIPAFAAALGGVSIMGATDWGQVLAGAGISATALTVLVYRLVTDHQSHDRETASQGAVIDHWRRIAEAERERADGEEDRRKTAESGIDRLRRDLLRLDAELDELREGGDLE